MPLYDYKCDTCGDFEAWRTMSEVSNPMPCPGCDLPSRRVYAAPNVNLNSGSLSLRGESKEPHLVKRQREPEAPKSQSPRGGRPWMIGHAPERL